MNPQMNNAMNNQISSMGEYSNPVEFNLKSKSLPISEHFEKIIFHFNFRLPEPDCSQ